MRILALTLLMTTPALANPCEELARAICPADDVIGECLAFVDNEMRAPDGKAMTGVNRLMGCKLALEDEATRADYRTRMQAKAETRWYTMQVAIKPRKADGAAWDALGGAPDVAACFTIDDKPAGCVPDGASAGVVRQPKCRDAMSCEFKVHARRGAIVAVTVVDVDEMSNDDIGRCAFVAGRGMVECNGQLTLTPEGVDGPAAGAVVDNRIVGRWDVNIERTMAQDPAFAELSIEARREAVDRAMGQMHEEYVEFGRDGRIVYTLGEEVIRGRYVVTELKGRSLTIEVVDERTRTWEVTVADEGLVVKRGTEVVYLERAR